MSIDMNLVVYGGRLTDEPVAVGNSNQGCRFDVATNRSYKKDGERIEDTTYMPVTVWGSLAELVMQRCHKGDQVIVNGRIEVRKFDGEDGSPRKYVNIVATDVRFVNSRSADTRDSTPSVRKEEPMPFLKGASLPPGVTPEAAAALFKLVESQRAS